MRQTAVKISFKAHTECTYPSVELDDAISSFRELLKQSWTRRAIRNLTTDHPPQILAKFTLSDVKSYRDKVWEQRETSYHEKAVDEVNSLVRKYNGLAPYAVRRPYYTRSVEVTKAYEDSAEDILRGVKERLTNVTGTGNQMGGSKTSDMHAGVDGVDGGFVSIRQLLLGVLDRVVGRWRT